MRSNVSTQSRLCHLFAEFVAAGAVAGCAHVRQPGVTNGPQTRAESSPPFSLAASSVRSTYIYESNTISFALDRIGQRGLPPDRSYRHPAPGQGLTGSVF